MSLGLTLDIKLLETAADNAGHFITAAAANAVGTRAKLAVELSATLNHHHITLLNTSAASTARHSSSFLSQY